MGIIGMVADLFVYMGFYGFFVRNGLWTIIYNL